MAFSSVCPKNDCNGTHFETSVESPKGSRFKLLFVRCSSCGAVVGVLDYYNIGALIRDFAKKLNVHLDD